MDSLNHDANCQDRWCWSDALFMAPPVWVALSKTCGDERYLAHADQEFWATTDDLYDTEERLFFRDSRYFTQLVPADDAINALRRVPATESNVQ